MLAPQISVQAVIKQVNSITVTGVDFFSFIPQIGMKPNLGRLVRSSAKITKHASFLMPHTAYH